MTEPGTLDITEYHPAAADALRWVQEHLLKDTIGALRLLEAFSSTGMSGNRLAEVCGETLRRVIHGETVSDRYLLGLAWTLRNMQDETLSNVHYPLEDEK